jgi:hypothetical protein
MLPSWDQIQHAAFDRWERRGRIHGSDREDWIAAQMDLTFDLNYRTIAEYPLTDTEIHILGDALRPRCRFCEQSPPRAAFRVRPAVPEHVGNTSLHTSELCDQCADQFAGSIDEDFRRIWQSLTAAPTGDGSNGESPAAARIPIGAYKCLIKMALSIMPERETSSFTDTSEWVSNPDHDFDISLLGEIGCLVYRVSVPYGVPWTSLASRIGESVPFPYMLFWLASGALVLQVHIPLCTQDEDLDRTGVRLPRRSFSTGTGSALRASACQFLPLRRSTRPMRRGVRLFA